MKHRLLELLAKKEQEQGRRMTIKEHAEALGLHPRSLSRWLDKDNPTERYDADILVKFCEYFGVGIGDILYYEPESEN